MKFFEKIIKVAKTTSPGFRKRLLTLLLFLLLLHFVVFLATIFFTPMYPVLIGLIFLAYGLGLRHAVDADHIAAIDNTTRKLMTNGKRPLGVGFFFSLGHSTIVIILSLLIALSAEFMRNQLPIIEKFGVIFGTFISSFFLLLIGIINLLTFFAILFTLKKIRSGKKITDEEIHAHIHAKGIMIKILTPLTKAIRNSVDMYIVGLLFGLGFDTASEVGLLSISAASGASSMPLGIILLLPLAFTAGMTLIDSFDGILMLAAYGWAFIEPKRKLYYNAVITCISVIIALSIGAFQAWHGLLQLLR